MSYNFVYNKCMNIKNNNHELTYESIANDIESYTKKSYLLTFLTWFTLIGTIWTLFSILMIVIIWDFTGVFKFSEESGETNCYIELGGFWEIAFVDNDTKEIVFKPNSKWGLIFIPIIGYLITIICSILIILISDHRRYQFKIYYKNFIHDYETSNSYININKSIFKSNLFYFHISWIILLTISFVTCLVLALEKPNIDFAFNSEVPENILKNWDWTSNKQIIEVDGKNADYIYINSTPGAAIISLMVLETLSLFIIVICNFLYKKIINKGIMDSIDKIIDEYFCEENLEENII